MKVVGLPSFPCLCVNIISVFFVLLNSKSIVADDDQLSVTSYGSFEIAMLRHGEKYATNRPCYKWEDVSPLYHGLTHVRGLNGKHGKLFGFEGSFNIILISLYSRNSPQRLLSPGCYGEVGVL